MEEQPYTWNQLTILSLNINGASTNFHISMQQFSHFTLVGLQETKLNSPQAEDKLRILADLCHHYTVFFGSNAISQQARGGVTILLSPDFPGRDTFHHLHQHDIPNCYMVLQGKWGAKSIYIHNLYAPIDPTEWPQFFQCLPMFFDESAWHIVMGDYNVPLNPMLDSNTEMARTQSGRPALLTWLLDLGVVDT